MDLVGLLLSLLPLIVVFLGIVWLKKSGTIMVLVGLALTALLCWAYFKTDPVIIIGGIFYGIVKSFGISVAVIIAMFMVFLMQLTGSLTRISEAVHNIAGTKEEKALFVGMGFGSFVTALGLVAPTLFPPYCWLWALPRWPRSRSHAWGMTRYARSPCSRCRSRHRSAPQTAWASRSPCIRSP